MFLKNTLWDGKKMKKMDTKPPVWHDHNFADISVSNKYISNM